MPFLAGVNHFVEGELLFALECFAAHGARERSLGTVALPVPGQMVLALKPRTANVAYEPPFRCVAAEVLFQQMFVQVLRLALGTSEHGRAVRAVRYPYLAGLGFELRCRQRTATGVRLFFSLFPLLGLRSLLIPDAFARVFQKMVQRERGRQMRQVVGYRRPGRSDALPRRRHPVGRCYFAVVGIVLRPAAHTGKVLVYLEGTGSEMGAYHREVHLLQYIAGTKRRRHGGRRLIVPQRYAGC